MKYAAFLVGLLALSVVVGSAPAFADPYDPSAPWDQTVAAAKKEGSLTIYETQIGAKNYADAIAGFTKQYGIKVNTLEVRVTELTMRLQSEQAAGKYLADVQMQGWPIVVSQAASGGIEKLGPLPNTANLRRDLDPYAHSDYADACFLQGVGILVNTDLVKPADEPKSWHDLLDSKWKGKMLEDVITADGAGQLLFAGFEKAFGHDFNEKWKAQNVTFDRDLINGAQRVARGEFPIYASEIVNLSTELTGLPVKVIAPSEGLPYANITCSVPKNAPHPNAARVFINYFLSQPPMLAYANAGQIPAIDIPDLASKLDPDMKFMAGAKLLPPIATPEEREKYLDMSQELFK